MVEALVEGEEAFEEFVAQDASYYLGRWGAVGSRGVLLGWQPYMGEYSPSSLAWRPRLVLVSTSGDLAYSSGDFKRHDAEDGGLTTEGAYFAIWRRDEDGIWRMVINAPVLNWRPNFVGVRIQTARDRRGVELPGGGEYAVAHGHEDEVFTEPPGAPLRVSEAEDLAYTGSEYWVIVTDESGQRKRGKGYFLAAWQKDNRDRWHALATSLPEPIFRDLRPDR